MATRKKTPGVQTQLWPSQPRPVDDNKDLSRIISPVAISRRRQDIASWREALTQAELAWYPQRVLMQEMFADTVLNAHVQACMKKRKDLTLLKGFHFCDANDKTNKEITELFTKKWMFDFISYVLDAKFFGYSLVKLGDCVNNEFPDVGIIRRSNVSPDRLNVTRYAYSISGVDFTQDDVRDWHVWVPTVTEVGAQVQTKPCGYGLLYPVAYYEIFLRNQTGNRGDYVEVFGQPLKHAKTHKRAGFERDNLERAMQNMAGNAYIITDPDDEIDFIDGSTGKGNEIFDSSEKSHESKISKVLLGHASALDATPGKLGGDDPAEKALKDIQSTDCRELEHIINSELIPRLRNIGFIIPEGIVFKTLNNEEKQAQRAAEDEANKKTAEMVKIFKDAGLIVDPKTISKITGLKFVGVSDAEQGEIVEKPDVESEAKAQLRGSIGGVQGILALQTSVSQGTTAYEAAIAMLMIVYGYEEPNAKLILGTPKPAPAPTTIAARKQKLTNLYAVRQ